MFSVSSSEPWVPEMEKGAFFQRADRWDCGQCWAFSQGLDGIFSFLSSPETSRSLHNMITPLSAWVCVFFPKQLTSHAPLHHIREVCDVTIIHNTPPAILPSPYGWSPCLWVMAPISACDRPHQPARAAAGDLACSPLISSVTINKYGGLYRTTACPSVSFDTMALVKVLWSFIKHEFSSSGT